MDMGTPVWLFAALAPCFSPHTKTAYTATEPEITTMHVSLMKKSQAIKEKVELNRVGRRVGRRIQKWPKEQRLALRISQSNMITVVFLPVLLFPYC